MLGFGWLGVAVWLVWRRVTGLPETVSVSAAFREWMGGIRARGAVYGVVVFACALLMFMVLLQQTTLLDSQPDYRYFYYPFQFLAAVLFAAVCWFDDVLPRLSVTRLWLVRAALLLIALSNVAFLDLGFLNFVRQHHPGLQSAPRP